MDNSFRTKYNLVCGIVIDVKQSLAEKSKAGSHRTITIANRRLIKSVRGCRTLFSFNRCKSLVSFDITRKVSLA